MSYKMNHDRLIWWQGVVTGIFIGFAIAGVFLV